MTTFEYFKLKLKGRNRRKVDHNTYLETAPKSDEIALRLYATDIITAHRDGYLTLTSGGYQTPVTKDRLNKFLPPGLSVFQKDFGWFLRIPGLEAPVDFVDGMKVTEGSGLHPDN